MWWIVNSIQWLFLLVGTLICGPIAILLALISQKASFYFSKHIWARIFCIIAIARVRVKNIDQIKNLDEHVIFCANHQSNYDIFAMYRCAINPIYFIAKKELKNKYKVKVLNFDSEIMKKMFEISSSVIIEFSNLGEIHKEIYNSWYDSLKKYNNYQKFSDYGYIKERINSLKI